MEVLLGEPTFRLVHEVVDVEPVEPLELKGKSGRVPAYRLVGIRSDWLFPPGPIRALGDRLRELGKDVEYHELDSQHGHDAFLKEWDQMTDAIGPFVDDRVCGSVER